MMIKVNCKFILVALFMVASLFWGGVYGQSPVDVTGYVSEMPSYTWQRESDKLWDNLIHNRINLNYSSGNHTSFRIEVRNRFFMGETVRHTPLYKFYLDNDPGWVDMSFNWGSSKNFVVNTVIDRFSYERKWNNWQLQVGRQRVNWSKSSVWNPNDIFNSYSYFDFDYEERPRMDGLHLTYHADDERRFEAVLKMEGSAKLTSALLYGFSEAGYDFQLLAGQINQEDYLLGAGWSRTVADAGFYGEFTFLSPFTHENDHIFVLSVGSNYTFNQSLTLSGEYLYSSNLNSSFEDFGNLIFYASSIKKLSVTDHSYYLSISSPISPSLDVSLAYVGFSFPVLKSFYISPTIDYSLNQRLSLSGVIQLYSHEWEGDDVLQISSFVRLKMFF